MSMSLHEGPSSQKASLPFWQDPKIIVVEDEPLSVEYIRQILEAQGFTRTWFLTNPEAVLDAVRLQNPDILILDMISPELEGIRVLERIKSEEATRDVSVIAILNINCGSLKSRAMSLGAQDFLHKPLDQAELAMRVRNVLQIKKYLEWQSDQNRHVENLIKERTSLLLQSRLEVIQRLAKAAEFRDNETGRHVIRVSLYASVLAHGLGMPAETVDLIQQTSPMHDLGKIGIPDSILLKPGKLSEEEWVLMKRHPVLGYEMLRENLPGKDDVVTTINVVSVGENPFINTSAMIALTHHEKWDGSGYPFGLIAEEIPIEGRIVAAADVFDALQAKRPYKESLPIPTCLRIMRESSGISFDPRIVEVFFDHLPALLRISKEYAEPIILH